MLAGVLRRAARALGARPVRNGNEGAASGAHADRTRQEIENFGSQENVHDLPEIFHFWSLRYVRPKLEAVYGVSTLDDFYLNHLFRYREENPHRTLEVTSIGAGNGDMEVRIAGRLRQGGLTDFRFSCVDINPYMLTRGREQAAAGGLASHFEFLETDVGAWRADGPRAAVLAHHSLHHIVGLEGVFANIRKAIGGDGYLLTCDMIGRNGHMRWPEALERVHAIWRTMPDRYKYNHLLERFEAMYENWDCSTEGFEGIRAQDILPLLVREFHFESFIAYGNLPDVFVDRNFGRNFAVDNAQDTAFIDRIGAENDRLIDAGVLKPTQMVAALRGRPSAQVRCYRHWTPEFCVRDPGRRPRSRRDVLQAHRRRSSTAVEWPYNVNPMTRPPVGPPPPVGASGDAIRRHVEALGPWFYPFEFDGVRTRSYLPPHMVEIFETRRRMVEGIVSAHFGERIPGVRCLDVGCHEGFYSFAMARLGVGRVTGVDVREANLARARFAARRLGHVGIEFRRRNVETLDAESFGRFDLTLLLGLVYHLENPMRALRNVRAVTSEMCVVESQVIDEVDGETEWGQRDSKQPYRGVVAWIDDSAEFDADNNEVGHSPIAMCPSPRALEFMLRQAGFARVEFVDAPDGAYEQHARGKRVVCAAYC